jgi:hypothetical protein
MPIYELRENAIHPATATSFEAEGIKERADLQRLLRQRIESLGEGLMVLAEEFSDWLDSSRRIDLLCVDTSANLVVVELKRNDDGSHMELQALRYAAMVARMTFDQAVDTLARQRNASNPDHDTAQADILTFLNWDEPDEANFAVDTRVILAAADFGKELTTCVLWLRDRGIDIRCVRLQPYRLNPAQLLVDIQQLIPPPETADFQTQIGVKRAAETKNRAERHDLRYQFWDVLLKLARTKTQLHANVAPTDSWLTTGIGRSGFSLTYFARKLDSQVEFYISKDKEAFRLLHEMKEEIEKEFDGQLDWQELPEAQASRIRFIVQGGYRSSPEEWPAIHENLVSAMIRLDKALRPRLYKIRP